MADVNKSMRQASKDKCYYAWNDARIRMFLEMLSDYQRTNGQNNGFAWKVLTLDFELKTSTNCQENTLKNKYNNLKKMWTLWKKLRDSDTGLGWDYENNCIDADPAWWAKKILENKDCRVFRKYGFHLEVESMMKILLDGTVATGSHCVAPSMDPPPSNTPIELNDEVLDPIDWDELNIAADLTNDREADNIHTPEDENQPPPCPVRSRAKGKKTYGTGSEGANKRNVRRKSSGKSEYLQHLELSVEANSKMIVLCDTEDHRSNTGEASNNTRSATSDSIILVDRMVNDRFIGVGTPVWCFAVSFLMSEEVSKMFVLLPGDEERVHWLKWEYKKEEKKGTLLDV